MILLTYSSNILAYSINSLFSWSIFILKWYLFYGMICMDLN